MRSGWFCVQPGPSRIFGAQRCGCGFLGPGAQAGFSPAPPQVNSTPPALSRSSEVRTKERTSLGPRHFLDCQGAFSLSPGGRESAAQGLAGSLGGGGTACPGPLSSFWGPRAAPGVPWLVVTSLLFCLRSTPPPPVPVCPHLGTPVTALSARPKSRRTSSRDP